MDAKLHRILLAADKPFHHSSEEVYDGDPDTIEDARSRGRIAVHEIGKALGRHLVLADGIQDAFFWGIAFEPDASVSGSTSDLGLKFSRCGGLVATYSIPGIDPLPEDECRQVAEILRSHGFTLVDGDVLRTERYDGVYDYFKSWHWNAPATWWDRFFEYD